MQQLGETLRAAREEKGVTDSKAAEETKIKVQHIRALESEDFDQMPAPVYIKGFIKLYAEYLGLDPNEMVKQYTNANAPLSPDQIVGDKNKKRPKKRPPRKPKEPKKEVPPPEDEYREEEEVSAPREKEPPLEVVGKTLGNLMGSLKNGIARLNMGAWPWKHILTVIGGLLVIVLIISSIRNCAHRRAENAEREQRKKVDVLKDIPEPYLDKEKLPGE